MPIIQNGLLAKDDAPPPSLAVLEEEGMRSVLRLLQKTQSNWASATASCVCPTW